MRQVETTQRLDTEIADRLFMVRTSLCLDRARIAKGEPYTPKGIYSSAVKYFDNSQTVPETGRPLDFSIYPEYKNRTFRSLLFELGTIIDASQAPLVKELLLDNEKLADLTSIPETSGLIRTDRAWPWKPC